MTEVKTKRQSASLDRRKLLADPIMVTTIVVLITFLTLFILYPLAILLVDSFYSKNGLTLDIFKRVLAMANFRTSIVNTLKVGFLVGILSTLLGLLFAYVEVYVKLGKFVRRAVQGGVHAARRFAALCAVIVHDYAVRQGGTDYPRSC